VEWDENLLWLPDIRWPFLYHLAKQVCIFRVSLNEMGSHGDDHIQLESPKTAKIEKTLLLLSAKIGCDAWPTNWLKLYSSPAIVQSRTQVQTWTGPRLVQSEVQMGVWTRPNVQFRVQRRGNDKETVWMGSNMPKPEKKMQVKQESR
jgi:hypothetical protein